MGASKVQSQHDEVVYVMPLGSGPTLVILAGSGNVIFHFLMIKTKNRHLPTACGIDVALRPR